MKDLSCDLHNARFPLRGDPTKAPVGAANVRATQKKK